MEVSKCKITMNTWQPYKVVIFLRKAGHPIQGWDGGPAMYLQKQATC